MSIFVSDTFSLIVTEHFYATVALTEPYLDSYADPSSTEYLQFAEPVAAAFEGLFVDVPGIQIGRVQSVQ